MISAPVKGIFKIVSTTRLIMLCIAFQNNVRAESRQSLIDVHTLVFVRNLERIFVDQNQIIRVFLVLCVQLLFLYYIYFIYYL